MIDMYVNLVINKKRTCSEKNKDIKQVPRHLKDEVVKQLKIQGYDEDGTKIL